MKYADVARRLKALGCQESHRRSSGSHRKWRNPANGNKATVPDHGSQDLRIGTIRAVVRDLGLDWNLFNDRR